MTGVRYLGGLRVILVRAGMLACAASLAGACGAPLGDEDDEATLEPEEVDEVPAWKSDPTPGPAPLGVAGGAPASPPRTSAAIAAAVAKSRGKGVVAAADFDLPEAVSLVRSGEVKSGTELERALNKKTINRLDVDGDGKIDPIQVLEVREGKERVLVLRAIPVAAGKAPPDDVAVPVATIAFAPGDALLTVTARYADHVHASDVVIYTVPVAWAGPVLVVPATTFLHWLYVVERPLFVGVWFVEVHVVPVMHGKHKHKKHKKHKGGGHWGVRIH